VRPTSFPHLIDLWVPEFLGSGGIQHYSRMLLRGLEEILPDAQMRVLSKNDAEDDLPRNSRTSYRSSGATSPSLRTARFTALLAGQTLARRPQLVIMTHLHFAPVAHALKRIAGLRYWVVAHGIEAWNLNSRALQRSLAAAEKVLPVSRHTRDRLLDSGRLEASRLSLLPNTIDETNFTPSTKPKHLLRRYGLREEQKIIFTLARLSRGENYKGHDLVLDALPRIHAAFPDLHYLLGGRGDDTERILRRVRELGLQNHVTLTGYLPERELHDHYNLCDLFVMPSRGEGFGIVFLEALACGKPVVAGDEDGSREPLLDGELGTLIDPHDADGLAKAIVRLLDPALQTDDQRAVRRRRMLERFGFAAFRKNLESLFES
jgi:glycosyltransferase involved in cell wall biosynthesis